MSKPLIIITRKLPDAVEAKLHSSFDVELNATDTPFSREQLADAMQRADILLPTLTDKIDAELIESAGSQLKMLASFGAGLDHIDVSAAKAKEIVVTNTPDALTDDTADITMLLMLGALRRANEGVAAMQKTGADAWEGWNPTYMMGRCMRGKKLGIVGMGRIGQAVAKRAVAFDMEIHYMKRNQLDATTETALNATYWADVDAMLREVDVVALTCPLTPDTHHLINAERLKHMKAGSFIINTARGPVMDEDAVIAALKSGHLGGVGLDVFDGEPSVNPAWRTIPNAFILPHLGSASVETRVAMGEKVIENIEAFLAGHTPPNAV